MHPTETKNQFIELRAQGLSLDAISSQLNVPRATLGRWHHESVELIQRLRALQWHLLEEQIGHRLEDSLQRIAQRIRKWEDELDERDPGLRKTVELARIIRDSRREYLQLRSILLAPLQPTRSRTACPAVLDPQKREKMRQTPDALDTTPLPANDLQQPESLTSHSAPPASYATRSEVAASETHDPHVCEAPVGVALPLLRGEGRGEGQTGTLQSAASPPPQAHNEQSAEVPVADLPLLVQCEGVGAPPSPIPPKKHKPYWLNGHYYENPEYPEHIARAMFARFQS